MSTYGGYHIRECVSDAVSQNGIALQFASSLSRNERSIVKMAVEQNPESLPYASDSLRKDTEIITLAVRFNPSTSEFMHRNLAFDSELAKSLIQVNCLALQHFSPCNFGDKVLIWTAVQKDGLVLQLALTQVQDDVDVVSAAVEQNALCLQ